jgi:hypothetical protein
MMQMHSCREIEVLAQRGLLPKNEFEGILARKEVALFREISISLSASCPFFQKNGV